MIGKLIVTQLNRFNSAPVHSIVLIIIFIYSIIFRITSPTGTIESTTCRFCTRLNIKKNIIKKKIILFLAFPQAPSHIQAANCFFSNSYSPGGVFKENYLPRNSCIFMQSSSHKSIQGKRHRFQFVIFTKLSVFNFHKAWKTKLKIEQSSSLYWYNADHCKLKKNVLTQCVKK